MSISPNKISLNTLPQRSEIHSNIYEAGYESTSSEEDSDMHDYDDDEQNEEGDEDGMVNVAGITGSRLIFMEHFDNFWKTMKFNTGCVRFYLRLC
jgi:hypothetical protein